MYFSDSFLVIYSFTFGYSEQVVVSQLSVGLRSSSNYVLKTLKIKSGEAAKAVKLNNNTLEDAISFGFTDGTSFVTGTYNTTDKTTPLNYSSSSSMQAIMIPVERNQVTTDTAIGNFELKETSGAVTNYLIQEKYTLPAKSINLVSASTSTGNKFTYTETSAVKVKHLEAYKIQQYMIRISKKDVNTDYDIMTSDVTKRNGLKLANTSKTTYSPTNAEQFLNGVNNYVDFWVDGDKYDKEQEIKTNIGMGVRFLPGNIEVYGLPKGDYRIELYSFRYSQTNDLGNVVITQESKLNFSTDNELKAKGIDILSFSSEKFPVINASLLTVSASKTPTIKIGEIYNSVTTNFNATRDTFLTKIYIDGVTPWLLNSDGAHVDSIGNFLDDSGNIIITPDKYYQRWTVSYTTPNIVINSIVRTVTFTLVEESKSVSTTYTVMPNVDEITGYPYQTIFAKFKNNTFTVGTFEITDRNMSKYTKGYKQINTANVTTTTQPAIDIFNLYKGTAGTPMTTDSAFNWSGNNSGGNSVIINKIPSNSKGIFSKLNTSDSFTYYTTKWDSKIKWAQSSVAAIDLTDTANIIWENPESSSFNVALSEEKLIFRIVKVPSGEVAETSGYPSRYYSGINPTYPLKNAEEGTNFTNFNTGADYSYVDMICNSGTDKEISIGNTILTYTKSTGLKIMGLTSNTSYVVQIYSLQDEDPVAKSDTSYDYRVLTYGGAVKIQIGKPVLDSGTYASQNDIFMIDSKKVDFTPKADGTAQKQITIGLITKTEEQLITTGTGTNFGVSKLLAQKDEESSTPSAFKKTAGAKITEYRGIEPVRIVTDSSITITPSTKSKFEYPLDIVFLVDNSKSMDDEIVAVRNGLKSFTTTLNAKGYNVNYNIITFGDVQDASRIGTYATGTEDQFKDGKQLAIFKKDGWLSSDEAYTAFGQIKASGGYWRNDTPQQENGIWALHHGIEMLNTNARWIDKSLVIQNTAKVDTQYYLPSKKWIIILSDENTDTDYASSIGYTNTTAISGISAKLKASNISLTGIYHLNFMLQKDLTNTDAIRDSYIAKINSSNSISKVIASNIGDSYINTTDTSNPGGITNAERIANNITKVKGPYRGIGITDSLGNTGTYPSDAEDTSYSEFALQGLGSLFSMYEMGSTGGNVSKALIDSVKNIGIIQWWDLKYTSPFSESDGLQRESVFSFDKIKSALSTATSSIYFDLKPAIIDKTKDRFYTVPETKIEANFINPTPNTNDTSLSYLTKKDDKIILEANARSQYTYKGVLSNFPIIKGTFIITGRNTNTNTDEIMTLSTGDKTVNLKEIYLGTSMEQLWYKATSEIDYRVFSKKFGKSPSSLVIKFIGESSENSITLTAKNIVILDKDPPKITDFKMTNVTLGKFMSELKDSSSTGIFDMTKDDVKAKYTSTPAVTTDGGIAIGSFTDDKQLNVKDGDKVKIEFTIDDENVTASSTGVAIIYNGVSYPAQHDPSDTATGLDSNGYPITKTRWIIGSDSNPTSPYIPYNINATNKNKVMFNIYDDVNNASVLNNGVIGITLFKEPNLLQNTTLIAPTSTDRYTGETNTEYYNSNNIDSNPVIGALAYLLVFNYDSSTADIGAPIESGTNIYATSGTKRWTSSVDGNFDFYDGKHTYNGTVYVMNSAGAIREITHYGISGYPSDNLRIIGGVTINNVIGDINIPTTNPNIFYVDTIAPVVKSISLEKTLDANGELNEPSLPKTNSLYNIIHGIIGETVTVAGGTNYKRPFKSGDNLSLTGTIAEKNIAKTSIGGENIFTDENFGTISGAGTYSKSGIAKDLGSQINEAKDVVVYDKAGNKAEYLTDGTNLTANKIQLTIAYDDRGPTALETKASVVDGLAVVGSAGGVSTKFTNDTNLPLTSSTGVPLSLVIVNNTVYGTVQTGTGNLKTILYSGAIPEDGLYTPTITTYSYSGVKGVTKTSTDNRIVLDTIVGGVDSNVVRKSIVPKITSTKLNEIFENTLERVGLASYSINSVTPGVSGLKSGSSDYTANIKNPLSGALYSTAESKSSAITGEEELTFTVPSGGTYKFVITLYDRLGNWKDIDYIIEIQKNIKIIGKKKGYSNITIDTQVDNSTNVMKIKSRKE